MVRNAILAAALSIGGLAFAGAAPASASDVSLRSSVSAGAFNAQIMDVRWRGNRGYYGGRAYGGRRYYAPRRYGYRRGYYRPAFGVYVAPRAVRRCWVDRRGYRVCRR